MIFAKKVYSYLVSYAFHQGTGVTEITATKKIKSYDEVQEVRKIIREAQGFKDVAIINLQLLGKREPDEEVVK